jgi:hypothetical protein
MQQLLYASGTLFRKSTSRLLQLIKERRLYSYG